LDEQIIAQRGLELRRDRRDLARWRAFDPIGPENRLAFDGRYRLARELAGSSGSCTASTRKM